MKICDECIQKEKMLDQYKIKLLEYQKNSKLQEIEFERRIFLLKEENIILKQSLQQNLYREKRLRQNSQKLKQVISMSQNKRNCNKVSQTQQNFFQNNGMKFCKERNKSNKVFYQIQNQTNLHKNLNFDNTNEKNMFKKIDLEKYQKKNIKENYQPQKKLKCKYKNKQLQISKIKNKRDDEFAYKNFTQLIQS